MYSVTKTYVQFSVCAWPLIRILQTVSKFADKFALVIDSALSGSTKCFPGQKVCEDSLLSEAVIRTALSYLVFLKFLIINFVIDYI